MVTQELIETILQRYQEKQNKDEIRQSLLAEGFEAEDIEDTLSYIQTQESSQNPVTQMTDNFFLRLEKTFFDLPQKVKLIMLGILVLVILLLISSLYLMNYPAGTASESRDFQRQDAVEVLSSALNNYHNQYNSYPSSLQQLVPEFTKTIPTDPKTGQQYSYSRLKNGGDYSLCIYFELSKPECIGSLNQDPSTSKSTMAP